MPLRRRDERGGRGGIALLALALLGPVFLAALLVAWLAVEAISAIR